MLREVERNLEAVVAGGEIDPKVQVVLHYLRDRQWLEINGAIIFSQYVTTAEWVLEALCEAFPNEAVALLCWRRGIIRPTGRNSDEGVA